MSLIQRIKHAFLSGDTPGPEDEFWYRAAPSRPGYVTQDSAMRLAAVWACVRVIAETIGSLPCVVYRRERDGGRTVDRSHSLYFLLHNSPNGEMTAFEFWELLAKDLCTHGNFYARIYTNAREEVTSLVPLRPQKMVVTRDRETGILVYTYAGEPFTASDILHIPGLGYDGIDNLVGYSPIEYQRQSMGLALDAESYGANFFANNATPPAYISMPTKLNDEGFELLSKWFKSKFGGVRNAGKLGILDEGGKIETVAINHRDMQFLELRKYQTEEIARIFRVPLHLIQSLDRATNNNIEQQALDFVTNTIRPWLVRIERRINLNLFGPRESELYYAEFNMEALLRGDSAARAAFYSSLWSTGALNANEIRIKENLNPYPGGEKYMVNGTMIPVEMAGQQYAQKVTP